MGNEGRLVCVEDLEIGWSGVPVLQGPVKSSGHDYCHVSAFDASEYGRERITRESRKSCADLRKVSRGDPGMRRGRYGTWVSREV